jgi:lipid-A-disaccharide synthase
MEKAGVQITCHIRDLATIGPREAISHFTKYYKAFRQLVQSCMQDPPAVAVLLDFPEFNLRLAKKLKRAGVKVIYYISPQVWAWRSGRVRGIRNNVDKMLVILPFEEEFYRRHGVNVEFVGHPLLEGFSPDFNRKSFERRFDLDPERKTIALLPGSRRKEVDYILPTLLRAGRCILKRMPVQFLISVAPIIEMQHICKLRSDVLGEDPNARHFRIVQAPSRDILANSDFAFVKSGTSTLEAALVGNPFLIVYKISSASWYLGNAFIRTPFKGLVNLIAQREIVPEYFQSQATPEALCQAALDYLLEPARAAVMRVHLAEIRDKLSARCASDTAAGLVELYL